eukprot:gene8524-212_t
MVPPPPVALPGFPSTMESTFEAFKRSSIPIKASLGLLLLSFIFVPILALAGPWRDSHTDQTNWDFEYLLVNAQKEEELVNDETEDKIWLDDWPDSDLKTATTAALILVILALLLMIVALVLFCLWLLPASGIAMIAAALLLLIAIIVYVAVEPLDETNPRGLFTPPEVNDQDNSLGWGAWMAIIGLILLLLAGVMLLAWTIMKKDWKKMAKIFHHISPVVPAYDPHFPAQMPAASFLPPGMANPPFASAPPLFQGAQDPYSMVHPGAPPVLPGAF